MRGREQGKQLRFAARVKAGLHAIHAVGSSHEAVPGRQERCPFADLPSDKSRRGSGVTADEMQEMRWDDDGMKPKLLCQVRFVEWTSEVRLRHAVYLGLRGDKDADDVRRRTLAT
jgi:bifunctional non-homologous end joining protein LigD